MYPNLNLNQPIIKHMYIVFKIPNSDHHWWDFTRDKWWFDTLCTHKAVDVDAAAHRATISAGHCHTLLEPPVQLHFLSTQYTTHITGLRHTIQKHLYLDNSHYMKSKLGYTIPSQWPMRHSHSSCFSAPGKMKEHLYSLKFMSFTIFQIYFLITACTKYGLEEVQKWKNIFWQVLMEVVLTDTMCVASPFSSTIRRCCKGQ